MRLDRSSHTQANNGTGDRIAAEQGPPLARPKGFQKCILDWWHGGWLPALLLALVTLWAYEPCLRGELVWDDDSWTLALQPLMQNLHGLWIMWTQVTALQQYYPLTATSFWIDYHLWGFSTLPYHLENVLLHLAAALLFWKLLRRLGVPGAGLAAAVFALHPVMVESAAWITERKNVLSLVLFLLALLSYGKYTQFWTLRAPPPADPEQRRVARLFYCAALLLFLAAYLAKATAFAFPAVLLLFCWWQRGTCHWRRDILPTLPFFGLSIALGLVTYWLERHHVGARGPDWALSFPERILVAGHALWFYLGKLVSPAGLCFIYPQWELDAQSVSQWLYPVTATVVAVCLWLFRGRIGRAPLAAALFYAGTLFPVLGFMNSYFMRYSFVCDHWVYLSSLGPIALGAALVATLANRLESKLVIPICAAVLLPSLAILTHRQSGMYRDSETLYRVTLARNPKADLAHNNLGLLLFQAGQLDQAIEHFEKAVAIRPNSAHAHNNLANALRAAGREREAVAHYEASLRSEPDNVSTLNNLALLLAASWDSSLRDGRRALELAQRANQLTGGRSALTLCALGAACAETGRFADAIAAAKRARLLVNPGAPLAPLLEQQLKLYESGSPFHEPPP